MRLKGSSRKAFRTLLLCVGLLTAAALGSCNQVDDDRIPAMAVSIAIIDAGNWNTYGVSGYGMSRRFILDNGVREPSGFPYSQTSRTGFGGVLLIEGMDPFSGETLTPLAYDLACPVEVRSDVRVRIEGDLYEAVCPVCGSRYDVCMGGGTPLSGPAATGKHKYGLRRYRCLPSGSGGYIITN